MQDVLFKTNITMDEIKEVLLPVKTTHDLVNRLNGCKAFDKKHAIAWLREYGAFEDPEPGNSRMQNVFKSMQSTYLSNPPPLSHLSSFSK